MWGTIVWVLIFNAQSYRPAVAIAQFAYEKDCYQAMVEIRKQEDRPNVPMCIPMQNMRPM